ncbi:uncharacterized protein V6R79_010370 [Siganus canaliculatus]
MEVMEMPMTEDQNQDPRQLWKERLRVADTWNCSSLASLVQEDPEIFNCRLKFFFTVALSLGVINLMVLQWLVRPSDLSIYLSPWDDFAEQSGQTIRPMGLIMLAAVLAVYRVTQTLERSGASAAVKKEKPVSGLVQQI